MGTRQVIEVGDNWTEEGMNNLYVDAGSRAWWTISITPQRPPLTLAEYIDEICNAHPEGVLPRLDRLRTTPPPKILLAYHDALIHRMQRLYALEQEDSSSIGDRSAYPDPQYIELRRELFREGQNIPGDVRTQMREVGCYGVE